MSTAQETQNACKVRRIVDVGNGHDDELISATIDEIFHPEVDMGTPLPIDATGAEAVKEVTRRFHAAFPDLHITVEEVIAKDDKVVSRQLVTGTHTGGEYMGVPTSGKPVAYNEIFILRFADGRVVETTGVVDVLTMLKQLGAIQ